MHTLVHTYLEYGTLLPEAHLSFGPESAAVRCPATAAAAVQLNASISAWLAASGHGLEDGEGMYTIGVNRSIRSHKT